MSSGEKLIRAIGVQGHKALKPLYHECREEFIQYMSRYTDDKDLRQDAFQEAMLGFYEYLRDGKYDPSKSKPKTMIFMMGRAYLINRLKRKGRTSDMSLPDIDRVIDAQMGDQVRFSLTDGQTVIRGALNQLGERCKKLLILFFYHNYSVEAISREMEYKNVSVVSSHKSRCMKQLKEKLKL